MRAEALRWFDRFLKGEDNGVSDLQATVTALRSDDACNGKVGTQGYCLGGKLAYLMATRTDADASVGFYGVGIEGALAEAGKRGKTAGRQRVALPKGWREDRFDPTPPCAAAAVLTSGG